MNNNFNSQTILKKNDAQKTYVEKFILINLSKTFSEKSNPL